MVLVGFQKLSNVIIAWTNILLILLINPRLFPRQKSILLTKNSYVLIFLLFITLYLRIFCFEIILPAGKPQDSHLKGHFFKKLFSQRTSLDIYFDMIYPGCRCAIF